MIKTLFQNLWAKVENELLPLVQSKNNIPPLLLFLVLLFLPTQLGIHFWPSWSYVEGARVDYLSPTLYVTDLLIIGLFISSIFSINTVRLGKKELILLSTVVFILIVNILLSPFPLVGWYFFAKILELTFLGWYIARHTKQTITFISVAFPIGLFTESILALWQFLLQRSVGGWWYFLGERTFSSSTPGIANASLNGNLVLRAYGTFPHPNVLAGYLLLGLVFLYIFSNQQPKAKRILWIFIGTVASTALLVTLSRSAILLGGVLFVLLILQSVFKRGKYNDMFFLGLLGIILALLLYPRFVTVLAGESIALRWELIVVAWKMFWSAPLLGIGLQNFLVLLPKFSFNLPLQPVHNIFLLVLSETGVVGFVLFILFLFLTIKKVFLASFESQLKKNIRTFAFFSLSIFICIGMVDHYFFTLQQGQLITSLLFGLAWSSEN